MHQDTPAKGFASVICTATSGLGFEVPTQICVLCVLVLLSGDWTFTERRLRMFGPKQSAVS